MISGQSSAQWKLFNHAYPEATKIRNVPDIYHNELYPLNYHIQRQIATRRIQNEVTVIITLRNIIITLRNNIKKYDSRNRFVQWVVLAYFEAVQLRSLLSNIRGRSDDSHCFVRSIIARRVFIPIEYLKRDSERNMQIFATFSDARSLHSISLRSLGKKASFRKANTLEDIL